MDQLFQLRLKTISADQLPNGVRNRVIELCTHAFEEDYRPFIDSFDGAIHVLGYLENHLVTHALWVTRWLQVDDGRLLRTAYVEGVATQKELRQRGFAQAVMEELVRGVEDYELAALSPFDVTYYARLGWELWRGPLFIRHGEAVESSPADEEVMIYRLPKTPKLDLHAALSAEWRIGEPW